MKMKAIQGDDKVLLKRQEKSFDKRKTTNTGISHDRRLAICHDTFCRMVPEKLFEGLQ